jgi:hypothetical protein
MINRGTYVMSRKTFAVAGRVVCSFEYFGSDTSYCLIQSKDMLIFIAPEVELVGVVNGLSSSPERVTNGMAGNAANQLEMSKREDSSFDWTNS